jgi:energy-coupling factor transporter ATP-binding protein EcfA2
MTKMEAKRPIPVAAEKVLKSFYCFLSTVKEDLVGGSVTSKVTRTGDIREKREKMLEQFKTIADVLPKHMRLDSPANLRELELVELVKSSEKDIAKDFVVAQARWVDLLLDKVTDILDSTEHVNLEKLTTLMEKNDSAGSAMEGKDVILLLGSPGCGKTTTMHYLAGTSFREIPREGVSYFKPIDVADPSLADLKVSFGGKDVITRHLQVATVTLNSGPVVLCDTPSFGDHETIEEVIANSLGLVRAIHKARTVRPVLVLSRDEIGFRDQFNAYPQILSILVRLLGTDTNVDLKPFNFVFTKYDSKNTNSLRRQFSLFLKEGEMNGNMNEANKQAIIKHLMEHTDPDANVIVPTKGDPCEFLKKLMSTDSFVANPESFFVPNLSDAILSTMKRQLKFTLMDLREALSKCNNSTAIHRMQQMSKLANLLPEAGIYARHGFKAFKEIINQMVEGDDEDDDYFGDDDYDGMMSHSSNEELKFTASRESFASSESEQWSNVSSKIVKSNSNDDVLVSRLLTTVPEEAESEGVEGTNERDCTISPKVSQEIKSVPSGPSPEFMSLAARCAAPGTHISEDRNETEVIEVIEVIEPEPLEAVHNETKHLGSKQTEREYIEADPIIPTFSEPEQVEKEEEDDDEQEQEQGKTSYRPSSEEYSSEKSSSESYEYEGRYDGVEADDSVSGHKKPYEGFLPEEDRAYAIEYGTLLKDMTIKAVEREDYAVAVQRMQEFVRLAQVTPEQAGDNPDFHRCVDIFLMFSVALRECDYHHCLALLQQMITMGESGIIEAKKCAECAANAAIHHIVELREQVVVMTSQLHITDDPDEFDRMSESLRLLRRKVDMSSMLMETCMRGSNDKGKSETVLACISYGFKVGRLSR